MNTCDIKKIMKLMKKYKVTKLNMNDLELNMPLEPASPTIETKPDKDLTDEEMLFYSAE